FYLVLYNADKKPPHIATICEGEYFSLSVDNSAIGIPLDAFKRKLSVKGNGCVFLKILNLDRELTKQGLNEKFQLSNEPGINNTTCLTPIKSFFKEYYNISMNKVKLVFDLINVLDRYLLILDRFHFNMHNKINE
ncbi:MAG: hypothetical protein ABEH43_03860, partial [Flavobacteriales bacterium]